MQAAWLQLPALTHITWAILTLFHLRKPQFPSLCNATDSTHAGQLLRIKGCIFNKAWHRFTPIWAPRVRSARPCCVSVLWHRGHACLSPSEARQLSDTPGLCPSLFSMLAEACPVGEAWGLCELTRTSRVHLPPSGCGIRKASWLSYEPPSLPLVLQ